MKIFIRTYKNDLPWLEYCLRSIQKFVTGCDEIVICIPEPQKSLLDSWGLTKERIVTCPVYADDYLGQQISKLKADEYCQSDRILFVDSDCVFNRQVNIKDLKPEIYKTHYSKVGDAICWKEPTEKALKKKVNYEYMRRLPLMYLSDTVKDCREYLELTHGVTVEQYITSQPFRKFSEFNVLGAFAEKFSDKYTFLNTDNGVKEGMILQSWSWGGITPEIKTKIEDILK